VVRKATPGQPTIEQLIWHPSDATIKPIVGNRRIERLPEPKWDAAALPFESKARSAHFHTRALLRDACPAQPAHDCRAARLM